jgi:hypothetical protein
MKSQKKTVSDLSHWDIETEFAGIHVAALVLGDDPSKAGSGSSKNAPIYRRLENAYNATRKWHLLADDAPLKWSEIGVGSEEELLRSIGMADALDHFDIDDAAGRSMWMATDEYSGFITQRFSRVEIARWLAACGLKSIYKFEDSPSHQKNVVESFSTKERKTLLKILLGIAITSYKYDPNANKSGAPSDMANDTELAGHAVTNDTIRDYLKEAVMWDLADKKKAAVAK